MAKSSPKPSIPNCPQCGDPMRPARVLSDAQHAQVFDKENPGAVPPHTDTASPAQRAKLGTLFECRSCTYVHRELGGDQAASDEAAS